MDILEAAAFGCEEHKEQVVVRFWDKYANAICKALVDGVLMYIDTPFDDLNGQVVTEEDRQKLVAGLKAGTITEAYSSSVREEVLKLVEMRG